MIYRIFIFILKYKGFDMFYSGIVSLGNIKSDVSISITGGFKDSDINS